MYQKEEQDRKIDVAHYHEHCHFARYELLKQMVEKKCALAFVWIDEGKFDIGRRFTFNEEHVHFEPLLVDFNTANMLILLHDALNPENQKRFECFVGNDGRGRFGQLVEMGWEATTFKKGAEA